MTGNRLRQFLEEILMRERTGEAGSDGGMTDSFYSAAASRCSMSRSLRLSVESRSDPDDYRRINGGSAVRLDVQKSKSASGRQRPSPGHAALDMPRARMHISDMQNARVRSLTLKLRCRSAGSALICQI